MIHQVKGWILRVIWKVDTMHGGILFVCELPSRFVSMINSSDPTDDLLSQQRKRVGRPAASIDAEMLSSPLSMNFTVQEIASKGLLGVKVHRNTIQRFLKKGGKSVRNKFSRIDDDDLRDMVSDLINHHPNSGYRGDRCASQSSPALINHST